MDVLKNRNYLKEDRYFLFSFSQNIEMFYTQAKNLEELLFLFSIWTDQFDVMSYELAWRSNHIKNEKVDFSLNPQETKTLRYENDEIKITFLFKKDFFELDSDIKLKCINQVVEITAKYINELNCERISGKKVVDISKKQNIR